MAYHCYKTIIEQRQKYPPKLFLKLEKLKVKYVILL